MPGMIVGHNYLYLHTYDETSWDDQVLHEPVALRTARAVASAKVNAAAAGGPLTPCSTRRHWHAGRDDSSPGIGKNDT